MAEIAFTKVALPFGWLGNMSPHPVRLTPGAHNLTLRVPEDIVYKTAEHAFQSARLPLDHPARAEIMRTPSPMAAKMVAKRHVADFDVEPLSTDDVMNMTVILNAKLDTNPDLVAALLATGDAVLIEDCTARPRGAALFWGAVRRGGGWTGDNVLGNLWMIIREERR